MKLYERSLKTQLVLIIVLIVTSAMQLVINISNNRPAVFYIMFALVLAVFVFLAVPVCLDLIRKDNKKAIGKIVVLEEFRIHILSTNGKIMKVRVKPAEYGHFRLDQEVELLVAKRSGSLLAMYDRGSQVPL